MKNLITLLFGILTATFSAQIKDKTSSFDVPVGTTHLLQLKNGNTFFMEITKKDGIKTILYDTLRKKIAATQLPLKLVDDKIGIYIWEGIYEMGGDPTFFMQVGENRTPVLLRIIVDGKTGKLKSEEKISELDKIKAGQGYGMIFAGLDIPDFDIVQDPESDYYALIRYNSLAPETNDRIEILHYSPQHKIINRAKYTAPSNKYKYTRYLSAYVNKDNYAVIATYGFNTSSSGGDEGRFYVSQLLKGKSAFKQQELSYKDYYKNVTCSFEYNKPKQLLHMWLITNTESKGNTRYYEYHFQNINPANLKVDKDYAPDFTQVNEYYREKMGNKNDYSGVLKKTAVDKSGNLILYFQETTFVTSSSSGNTKTYYGDVALLTITPAGKTINSAVFPASILASAGRAFGTAMISTEANNYILFNNTLRNMELDESKEAKPLKTPSVAVPVKYTYGSNAVRKDFLFKKPKEEKGNPYCDFETCHYNEQKKKLAVLHIMPEKDKACLVWMDFN